MIENSLVSGDIFGSQIADSCLDSKWLARFCLNGSLNIGYTEISVGQLVNPNIVDKNPVVAVIILAVNGAFEYERHNLAGIIAEIDSNVFPRLDLPEFTDNKTAGIMARAVSCHHIDIEMIDIREVVFEPVIGVERQCRTFGATKIDSRRNQLSPLVEIVTLTIVDIAPAKHTCKTVVSVL